MIAKFTYYKDNGNYYSEGEVEINAPHWYGALTAAISMLERGVRPGLVDGFTFDVEIEIDGLPYLYRRQRHAA